MTPRKSTPSIQLIITGGMIDTYDGTDKCAIIPHEKAVHGLIPKTQNPVTNQVKQLILSNPLGTMTADDVAREMYITKRTLQRRLEREGMTYRMITEKLNAELSVYHLNNTNLTIYEVAVLLGYNDSAAFRKAFRRWYGLNPTEFRNIKRHFRE